ncbi:2-haloacid dehalogenase [Microdochium nivale]|nr:2-haloacid dehalogenase [Microdochium nivale]
MDQVKALTFDVFGTVVDWRTTVVRELVQAARDKLLAITTSASVSPSSSSSASSSSSRYKARLESLSDQDWARFAQSWRDSYGVFTQSFVPGRTAWKDIDAHHLDSLIALLVEWGLGSGGVSEHEKEGDEGEGGGSGGAGGSSKSTTATAATTTATATTVYTQDELQHLSLVWHRLEAWPDSAAGLRALAGFGSNPDPGPIVAGVDNNNNKRSYTIATLSNGTRSLLMDLNSLGGGVGGGTGLGFQRIISTADFGAYKPHPSTYQGACAALGLAPGQVAMVAAHLGDLAAARAQG